MRVLYLADPFLPIPPTHYGGIERIAASVIRGALARGHVAALAAHPESKMSGVELHPLRGGAQPTLLDHVANLRRIRRALTVFQPDLIHSFARLAYLAPALSLPVPKIMAFHREPTPRTVRWASRLAGSSLVFTGCSRFITLRGAVHGGQWRALPNGIELDDFTFQPEVAADAPLVFLSRIERVKGAHHAIATARAMGRKLVLAGNHAKCGPEFDYWRKEIAPHLGRNGISYIGPVDDEQKSRLLGRARALLVPIQWEEPFGMVFVEALACGTPVVSMRRGALPEIVRNGREGFLCEKVEDLAAALEKIPTLSRADCREKVRKKFSAARMAERHEFLYKTLDGLNVNGGRHVHEASEG